MAVEHNHIEENPVKGIAKRKESGPRTRYLSDAEVARFLPILRTEVDKGNPSAQAILVLFLTGLRRSECLGMRFEHLDLGQRGTLFIPHPKNGQPRTVPLNSLAIELLKTIRDQRGHKSEFVFPSKSGSGHMTETRKTLATLQKRAGIDRPITTHDLRRGFSSMLANSGQDLRTIGELIGHRDLATTRRVYAHLENGTLRKASETIVTKVEGLLSSQSG